ncbi:MAG: filamentous hemagglutinin N-terminal domain-containing protein, partial [bacterium]
MKIFYFIRQFGFHLRYPISYLLFCILHFAFCISSVYPLPQVDEIVSGTAQVEQINPHTLEITASSDAIINYKSFDIGEGESVIINLPSIESQILNKVLGREMSQLMGKLNCNGLFILINRLGIYIGPQAKIDIASAILSTRDIANTDFLKGEYLFEKLSQENLDMLLLNRGTIKVKDGGFGVLIAGGIENEGKIIANAGKVVLAGGDAVKLNISNNGLISVIIDEAVASEVLDHQGNPITDQIKNTGTIEANGGTIILTAQSLPGIFTRAINLEGFVMANRVENKGGIVKIVTQGDVRIAADIKAGEVKVGDPQQAVPENVYIQRASIEAQEIIEVLANNDIEISQSRLIAPQIILSADYERDGIGKVKQIESLIQADTLKVSAPQIDLSVLALNIEVYKNIGDIYLTSSATEGGLVTLQGEDINLTYLALSSLILKTNGAIDAQQGVVISASSLYLQSNKFGKYDKPLNINANSIHLNRTIGDMQILDSLGIGTSIMLRGPPEEEAHSSLLIAHSWGAILYKSDVRRPTNLTLEAEKVVLLGENPTYLQGNITFYNFNCTIPGKEIYFEAGKIYTFKGLTYIKGMPGQGGLIKLLSSQEGEPWYSYFKSE